ncbi:serine/threonine-protein phosphatase [Occultella glacieicola]|uniref:Serine/threonine-protein phosphatase n=1 Tax=Occultella glacieicola TaxID=2518684 RepID=A0ABY2EC36_9MICO|nr:PP2C family serine/threonine-protein phosphatase [Occultella glacieicola]TDE98727.1 serine/threonine-protein phosphatase [Occultella glacieicola]
MTLTLKYVARSDVGLVRSVNQDSGYAGPHLLVLADGMGGPAGGDIASSVAVAHLAPLDGEAHGGDDLVDQLRRAVGAAHTDLVEYSDAKPELAGLGTTVIALLRSGRKLGMVHVGDSRAYLLRDGELIQITADHTFVQHLVDLGQLSPEEAEHHPHRSVLLRVLGDDAADVELDESVREARAGDRWLLCSDGLSSYVSAETITETVTALTDLGECADALIDLALRAGGQDNITIVLADVVETDELPETTPMIVGAAAVDRSKPTRGGDSAAARAAALTRTTGRPARVGERPDSPADAERYLDDDDDDGRAAEEAALALEPPRRRALRLGIGILVSLALIAGALTLGYRWTQTQYFVAPDGDHVAIYQGIPQSLGPLDLSHLHETTTIALEDLPAFARTHVEDVIAATSLADAQAVVEDLRSQSTGEP